MPEISHNNEIATFIVDFWIDKDKTHQLSKIAQENIEKVMSKKNGFISANIHESLTGNRLINYSQWKSRELYENAINLLAPDEVLLGEKLLENGEMSWNFFEIVSSIGEIPTNISVRNEFSTGMDILDVNPKNCKQVMESLLEYNKNVLQNKSGFISANIHKSDDAKRLINYLQWDSFEGLDSLFRKDDKNYYRNLKNISEPVWNTFKVVYCKG